MVVQRGELWWADLGEPRGSEPALRRPVLVLQADSFNRSKLQTVVVISLTTNVRLAAAPGNVLCRPRGPRLREASVVNVSQLSTLDRRFLIQRIGRLSGPTMRDVESGVKRVLGLGANPV
ncbi:MAG TPA: type II toxin-antitoxin system PemK/MazF family toxin [Vicinamibacteria bacterium]|nr:type II toxin-antitoxin system PemK/MazF family toxin [Vicinamibacteria bacterium]